MTPGWLADETAKLRGAYAAGRLPHALLIHEAPGSGGEWLAGWIARMVLCANRLPWQAPSQEPVSGPDAPCERCASCQRAAQGQHPDLMLLRPLESSTQIRIEQVRELSEELSLTSHQGGYKVAILSPADTMNRFAANALLKTLEEPPQGTLLILVATQPSRLPPTILSRCQRVRVRAPARADAVAWLEATRGPGEWGRVLSVLGTAPMLAAAADPDQVAAVAVEVRRELEQAAAGEGDPVATAERWARSELPLRLICLENWLTDRIRGRLGAGALFTEVRVGAHPRGHGDSLDLRQLFELLDAVRELKSSFDAPINRGLALESLLRSLDARGLNREGRG
ncbi:MAG TPA: DNA polymerase III subunit delta' [Steroidobacteraceae bacterium]|nr:DNA polymerase III subunit delta' [Steroidobacteraceae bacterium]